MSSKFNILIFIWCIFVLGCSDPDFNQECDQNKDRAILFKSYITNEINTKGLPITNSNDLQEIVVYGYYTGNGTDNSWTEKGSVTDANFFDAQVITNLGYKTGTNKWEYSPVKYWPSYSDVNISFFSYAPQTSDVNGITINETKGGLSLNYTAPVNCSDQPDLMMSLPAFDLNAENGSVALPMKHMLTSIGFSAIGTLNQLESITLKNIIVSGTISYDSSGDSLKWDLGDITTTSYNALLNDTILYTEETPVITSNGYLLLPPQTLPSGAEIIVTTKSDSVRTYDVSGLTWQAGQQIMYELNLSISPADISVEAIETSYVGAYWRYNETGERIIRMNSTGDWAASVIATDDQWSSSDILIDYLPSDYNSTIGTLISEDIQQMNSTSGVVKGTGNISFRIGLKSDVTLSSNSSSPRYALVMIKYEGLSKNHLIFLRQGEAPDVVTGSTYFSPYNLSSTESSTVGIYEFTTYPTQAGGYQQWSPNGILYPVSGGTTPDSIASTVSFANSCPTGYTNPTYEDFESLISEANSLGGFYADGFFDRLAFSINGFGSPSVYYVMAANNTAFAGCLFYNINTYAAIFLPDAGRRPYNLYDITYNGLRGWYWTSTLSGNSSSYPYVLQIQNQNMEDSSSKVEVGFINYLYRTDCNSIRPVLTSS